MAAGLARLEVTFRVDADGLLSVHAKEERTGLEQTVEVKPSYGLDDDTVEQMLIDAIDHGEEDLAKRKLAEARVEAHRVLTSTKKSLDADPDLLEAGERAKIEAALAALDEASKGEDSRRITLRIEELDDATKDYAGRRMNRAIAKAIEGHKLEEVEETVEKAKGVEEAHAWRSCSSWDTRRSRCPWARASSRRRRRWTRPRATRAAASAPARRATST
jgi:molecular chaperone HscA